MAKFQVLVTDSGRVLVTTSSPVDYQTAMRIYESFADWRRDPNGVLVVPDSEIMRVLDVEMDESMIPSAKPLEAHAYVGDYRLCQKPGCGRPLSEGPHLLGERKPA